jgi:putative ABC transport system ATP-binding protein
MGFEPTVRLPAHTLSKRAPSTTRTPLRTFFGASRYYTRKITTIVPCESGANGFTLDGRMAIIQLDEVSKLYGFGDAANVALDSVSLEIDQGEFVAVMGPSGCGKSTLMNVIGLLDRPSHGTYKLHNRNVTRFSANKRAKMRRDGIGFIFQSYNLLPRLTVRENVALPLAYKGVSVTRRLRYASIMLERVGLQQREYYYPRQLSGGQAQCVAIARALVNDPNLIIADEPTGNLDSESSRLIMELLSEIHRAGNTILFVTHNPELTRYATRVVYMHDGTIVHDEATKLGEVAATARRTMYTIGGPKTVEDDLAGVSALMKAVPGSTKESEETPKKRPARPRKTTRRPTRRIRKAGT